jgi:hypothetical protein
MENWRGYYNWADRGTSPITRTITMAIQSWKLKLPAVQRMVSGTIGQSLNSEKRDSSRLDG